MLGWHIKVMRQTNGGQAPARLYDKGGDMLAVWQTPLEGINWIDRLVKEGSALNLGGCGYPTIYTAPAKYLIDPIVNGPPYANAVWVCGPQDIVTSRWHGKTTIDDAVVQACRPDEWLLVEVWDES